jgi:hypothetical protein
VAFTTMTKQRNASMHVSYIVESQKFTFHVEDTNSMIHLFPRPTCIQQTLLFQTPQCLPCSQKLIPAPGSKGLNEVLFITYHYILRLDKFVLDPYAALLSYYKQSLLDSVILWITNVNILRMSDIIGVHHWQLIKVGKLRI